MLIGVLGLQKLIHWWSQEDLQVIPGISERWSWSPDEGEKK